MGSDSGGDQHFGGEFHDLPHLTSSSSEMDDAGLLTTWQNQLSPASDSGESVAEDLVCGTFGTSPSETATARDAKLQSAGKPTRPLSRATRFPVLAAATNCFAACTRLPELQKYAQHRCSRAINTFRAGAALHPYGGNLPRAIATAPVHSVSAKESMGQLFLFYKICFVTT